MRVFLLGFMGSGKSHWAKELSHSLDLPLIDLDDEIVKQEGYSISDIFHQHGEDHFRKLERDYLRKLSEETNFILSCGGGTPCYFDNMDFMNSNGITVWLDAPMDVMIDRLKRNREKRPLIRAFNDEQLATFVRQKAKERKTYYEQARLIINPVDYTVTTLTEKIKSCTNPI